MASHCFVKARDAETREAIHDCLGLLIVTEWCYLSSLFTRKNSDSMNSLELFEGSSHNQMKLNESSSFVAPSIFLSLLSRRSDQEFFCINASRSKKWYSKRHPSLRLCSLFINMTPDLSWSRQHWSMSISCITLYNYLLAAKYYQNETLWPSG